MAVTSGADTESRSHPRRGEAMARATEAVPCRGDEERHEALAECALLRPPVIPQPSGSATRPKGERHNGTLTRIVLLGEMGSSPGEYAPAGLPRQASIGLVATPIRRIGGRGFGPSAVLRK